MARVLTFASSSALQLRDTSEELQLHLPLNNLRDQKLQRAFVRHRASRRRYLQIENQCGHALSRCLVDRLRAEQRALAGRVSELQRSVAEIKRLTSLDPMSVAFLGEVARRSWVPMRCSLG